MLKVKRMSEYANLPARATPHIAGVDLYSAEEVVILPHSWNKVSTDIVIELPVGTYGRIAPRSGLAF
jgi:dUTP pyrophosphatase